MEAGFSKSSLINIIDNPTDKEIVRELCLAALAQEKKTNSFQKWWYNLHTIQKTKCTELHKVGFLKDCLCTSYSSTQSHSNTA